MAVTSITDHRPVTAKDIVIAVENLGKAIAAYEMAELALDNAVKAHSGNVPEQALRNLESTYHMALAEVLGCQKRIVHIARAVVGLTFVGDADVLVAGGVMAP